MRLTKRAGTKLLILSKAEHDSIDDAIELLKNMREKEPDPVGCEILDGAIEHLTAIYEGYDSEES